MKRIVLFAAVNIAVLAVITAIVELLGLERYLGAYGLSVTGLLVLSAVFGFGGAFISLALSKWMAKIAMGVRVIGQPGNGAEEQLLLQTVHGHATRLGLAMPEVGIFESPALNAFATGARRDRALVAVSSGLLQSMDSEQVRAVLGHEMTHVANGDMVTLALLQGVLNTFVIFLARIVGTLIDSMIGGQRERREGGLFYFATVIVLQIVFGVLATLIVMAYSRHREYRADAGGARLAGRQNMIGALRALQRAQGEPLPGQFQAFGIHDRYEGGPLRRLFMSHPPLEERIAALEAPGRSP